MFQIPADSPAEIKSDTAGLFIISAVISGKPFFKNPRKVLRIDADARIPDAQRLRRFQGNRNPAGTGVLQSIGNHLLHHKKQPFFIGQYLTGKGFIFQGYSLPYKLGSILAHRLFYNSVQIIIFQNIIRRSGIQPKIGQHHFHILFDALKLLQKFPVLFKSFPLKLKPHGCDRRFDLMHPNRIIVHHLSVFLLHRGYQPLFFIRKLTEHFPVVFFDKIHGFRQMVGRHPDFFL